MNDKKKEEKEIWHKFMCEFFPHVKGIESSYFQD